MATNTLSKRESKVKENLSNGDNNLNGWDRAIADAEKGIKRLQSAISVCRERKEAGEPWPGDDAGAKGKFAPAKG